MFGLNKLEFYGALSAIIIVVLISFGLMWENSIKKQATLEFNNAQLQQNLKDEHDYNIKLTEVNKIQEKSLDQLKKENDALALRFKKINDYLKSDVVKKNDTKSSDVLKETIKQLQGIE
jgi:uncharacterized protein YktB (UPF0637 family)